VDAADPRLRARIERALAVEGGCGAAIVTTETSDLAALRAGAPGCPLIVVGVRRSQVAGALDGGADAVLTGPLREAELRARLRALARRRDGRVVVGALELDLAARRALLDGAELLLPRREFALLCRLASAPGRVFSKAELAGSAPTTASRTLERQMARLRLRLGPHAQMLVTVWGVGYRLGKPA